MRAAVLKEPLRIEIEEVPLPDPGPQEVRVKIEGTGVCASNIPPWEGREWFTYPMEPGALGHEAWGLVDEVGPGVGDLRPGDKVAFLSSHAYAEFDVTQVGNVVRIPPELGGVPFPAEPLGCAMNIFRRSGIEAGMTVAIVGIGFLGSLLTQLAAAKGARVIAISRRPFAEDMARQMGASEVIPMDDHWQIIEQVKNLTGERLCEVVIEAVGKQWPLDLAAELTGVRGRLVVAGYHQDGPRQVNMQLWNWRGLDVINAHERDPEMYRLGMEDAVKAVASGALDPTPLYTHRYRLDELGRALDDTRDRPQGFMKALIIMQEGSGS
ncbi:MAG TPA: zinc-binding dehydrogenase [Fimbriimonadaceae bacterium]|nr:zinc-binding dehydrogenase [Fimbriimonadaceae bacterium]